MCVVLNKEIAVVSLLTSIANAAIELNKKDEGSEGRYSVQGVKITPDTVMQYSNLLSEADCGPIIKVFDKDAITDLLESKSDIFEKDENNTYKIELKGMYAQSLPDQKSENYLKAFRKVLFQEFVPDINYPRSFLKFMRLCD